MPRLRMKASTGLSSSEEAVLRATRRASRKSSKRHPTESISPPRNRPSIPPLDDFDESSLPPHQAYKKTRTVEEEEEEFREKLNDASIQDQGVEYHEHVLSYSTPYGSAAGNAAGVQSSRGMIGMDEEEYAEYIRAGIWRRQNRERLEWMEKQEKLRKEHKEKERVESIERERKEKLKRKKLEERKKAGLKEERDKARERYEFGWKKLQAIVSSEAGDATLGFTDFVWPSFPPFALPPISWPTPSQLDQASISEFLIPSTDGAEDRKAKLRTAVLNYHPDRFEKYVKRVKEDDGVQERVRELGLRVSQVLNDILKEEKGKGPAV